MAQPIFARIVGGLTAAYGAYTFIRPDSLGRAAGLRPRDEPGTPTGRALGRLVGARDVLSGIAMAIAPVGAPLTAAVIARVACDTTDAIGLGLSVRPASRLKVIGVTAGWALLSASTLFGVRGR